jgi:hypothetical protein
MAQSGSGHCNQVGFRDLDPPPCLGGPDIDRQGWSTPPRSFRRFPVLCRFSDAGNNEAGHTLGDRRRKSATARNRGGVGHRRCRGLYGDLAAASGWARLDRIARGHRIASRGGCGRQAERPCRSRLAVQLRADLAPRSSGGSAGREPAGMASVTGLADR